LEIVDVVTLQSCGAYAASRHWKRMRKQIHDAVKRSEWPEFVSFLKAKGWATNRRARNALDWRLGYFDAVLAGPEKPIVAEWEASWKSSASAYWRSSFSRHTPSDSRYLIFPLTKSVTICR
jgi:hypothetical protein